MVRYQFEKTIEYFLHSFSLISQILLIFFLQIDASIKMQEIDLFCIIQINSTIKLAQFRFLTIHLSIHQINQNWFIIIKQFLISRHF